MGEPCLIVEHNPTAETIARLIFENDRVLVDRFELTDDGRDRLVAIGQLGIVRRAVGESSLWRSARWS